MAHRTFAFILLCFAAVRFVFPQERTLKINSNDVFPRSAPDKSGFEDLILDEAFRRVGYSYELIKIPSERALTSVDRGEIDGDYVRIAGLGQSYPNLVMVAEPIAVWEFAVFAAAGCPRIAAWEDLRDKPFGRIIGWKIVEQRTEGFPHATTARDENSLFALLRAGRVDAVVFDRLQGAMRGETPAAVLEKRDMHLYLHRDHAELAGKLGAALKAMRQEGLIDRITRSVLEKSGIR